jgi:hypothetical protein
MSLDQENERLMTTLSKPKTVVLSKTLTTFLDELGDECQTVQRLLAQLQVNGLSTEQVEDILAELTASVVHLHVHTANLQDLINDELARM